MRKKILVIEDDRSYTRLAEYTLSEAGYDVLLAHDGFEGLSKTIKELPDLIILDAILPGIDGIDVCRWLRANAKTSDVPIIVVSAKMQQEGWDKACDYGADCFLHKPMEPSLMLEMVADLTSDTSNLDTFWPLSGQFAEYAS